MSDRLPQIAVRVQPGFRDQITQSADRHHDGNESSLIRESIRLYIALRRKLGAQFEPTIHILLGDQLDRAYADIEGAAVAAIRADGSDGAGRRIRETEAELTAGQAA